MSQPTPPPGPPPDMEAPEDTPGAAPAKPATPVVPVRETVADAWSLLLSAPRAVMLPSLVIQVPLAIIVGAVTSLLFLTTFKDEPFVLLGEILSGDVDDAHQGLIFALVAIAGVQLLFSQVARAATVVSVAAAAAGKPKPLAEALDPAFTRMGAVLWHAILWLSVNFALVGSIIGIPFLPYVVGRLAVSVEVMMLEQQRPMSALGGSWKLLSRKVTRVLGVVLLTVLICIGPFLAVSFMGLAVTGSRTQEVIMSGVVGVAQALVVTPAIALLSTSITLFYLKAREIEHGRSPSRIRPAQPQPPGQSP